MGCQKAVAKQIIAKGGEYVLALKGNQSNLHEDVKLFFEDARAHAFYHKDAGRRVAHRYYEATEKDHGRLECVKKVDENWVSCLHGTLILPK